MLRYVSYHHVVIYTCVTYVVREREREREIMRTVCGLVEE